MLVLVSTLGITFAMFGRCHATPAVDIALRCLLAAVSFVVMFHPDMWMSALIAVPVVVALVAGIRQHRLIAPPKSFALGDRPGYGRNRRHRAGAGRGQA